MNIRIYEYLNAGMLESLECFEYENTSQGIKQEYNHKGIYTEYRVNDNEKIKYDINIAFSFP